MAITTEGQCLVYKIAISVVVEGANTRWIFGQNNAETIGWGL